MVYCNKNWRSQSGPISVKLVRFASQIEELWYIVIRAGREAKWTYFTEIGPFWLLPLLLQYTTAPVFLYGRAQVGEGGLQGLGRPWQGDHKKKL